MPAMRYFEDLRQGERIPLGMTQLTKEMIRSFARDFDPFPFHLDEQQAKASLLGGLAASGWQTAALSLRMLVDAFLSGVASAGSLGFRNLKWLRPVMAGDTITGEVTVSALRASSSHPGWGILSLDFDIRNQHGQPVMIMTLANLVERRDAALGNLTQ